MQRSKFDIGRADVGAGGMSISSGSGGASGMGASSSPRRRRAASQPECSATVQPGLLTETQGKKV